ncbi:hypothetical protein LINPERPRIM_LOCUS31779 [Linum perenne]
MHMQVLIKRFIM